MIHLDNGQIRLSIDPDRGAGIGGIEALVQGVWQPVCLADDTASAPLAAGDSALFVMVPFANRARDNVLAAGPQVWPLPRNTSDPLALHGVGWQRPWTIAHHSDTACALRLSVTEGFPFAWSASLGISLTEDSVTCALGLTNDSHGPIPVGMGFHPYFPRRSSTRVGFDADAYWHEGDDHLPTSSEALPSGHSYHSARALPDQWQNNCYTGWGGTAQIDQPDLGYTVTLRGSAGLPALMLYSSPELARFAVEPQSHLSGRTTVSESGLRALAPGQSWTEQMEITVEPKAR